MSYYSTGVSAVSTKDSKLSCDGYYSDTTVLDFTSDGQIAVIENGETKFGLPLTDNYLPIDNWSTSTIKLEPDSEPYIIDAGACGDQWKRRQLSQFVVDFWERDPRPAFANLVIMDSDGNTKETGKFDVSAVDNAVEMKEALAEALCKEDLELADVEVYQVDSEYAFTLRTCAVGEQSIYTLEYYDEDSNLLDFTDIAEETRSAIEYINARPSFLVLLVTYGSSSSNKSGSSCGCNKNNGSGSGGSKCGSSMSYPYNSTGANGSGDGSDSATIKWTNADLYGKYPEDPDIWDNLGTILIHSGKKNVNEDDDHMIRPLVLKNDSGMTATVKILMAY